MGSPLQRRIPEFDIFDILTLPKSLFFFVFFSRVLRDSIGHYVGLSVGRSVGLSVGRSVGRLAVSFIYIFIFFYLNFFYSLLFFVASYATL